MTMVQGMPVRAPHGATAAPRFSFYIIPFRYEPLARSAERLARLGYDALEIPGDPAQYLNAETRAVLGENGLGVSAVCAKAYGAERDLTTTDANSRRTAFDYFASLVDMAAELGAPAVVVGPLTAVRRNMPESPIEQEWDWAVDALRRLGEHARGTGVRLVIEPWNRYETHLVNRIDQALQLRRDVDMDNVGVMGDLFHMNIEERDIAEALRRAGPALLNIHFADNNRRAPGQGHMDFTAVMSALRDIGYQHYLSVEYLPPRFVFETGVPPEFLDPYTAETIATMRQAWADAERSPL